MTAVPKDQGPGGKCDCGWIRPRMVAGFSLDNAVTGNFSQPAILVDLAICVRCPICDTKHVYAKDDELLKRLDAIAEPGGSCVWCGEPLAPNMLAPLKMHPECALRNVVGSVGHQRKEKGPCDDTCKDDPSLTKRQAAKAATEEAMGQMGLR